jgi:hypothetical protein
MGGDDDQTAERVTASGTDSPGPGLADDALYRVLASTPRRRVLYYLLEHEESDLQDLAAMLTGWEGAAAGETAGPAEYERIRTELTHVHLPMLAETGLVTHDQETGRVELAALDDEVRDLVRRSVDTRE